ncbi:hypothetical protein [Streptomyces coeruleorubidus]|uniref:hypothetical protein n=1 Tax=Streptomyces coeruleorubidus TaxID=116188 RepID=UPI003F540EF2
MPRRSTRTGTPTPAWFHLAQRPELSLLAIGLGTHIQSLPVTTVLRDTRHPIADPIVELIAQGLGKHPAAEMWRNLVAVDLSFYKSYISEEIRDEGRDEGRAEGEARRAAEDVLEVLEVRGIDVPEAVRERIVSCGDPQTLRRRHRRAVIAPSAELIFSDEQDE